MNSEANTCVLNALTGDWYCIEHEDLVPKEYAHYATHVGSPRTCTECGKELPLAPQAAALLGM